MDQTEKMPQLVEIEHPSWTIPPDVYCPICGKKAFDYDNGQECEHLVFFFPEPAGEFVYVEEQIRSQLEDAWFSVLMPLVSTQQLFSALGFGSELMILETSYRQEGHQSSSTDIYAFDWSK